MFPQSRRGGIIVRELADETLVFDREKNKAHCLNRTAAFVWKHCDGRTSVNKLADLLHEERELPAAGHIVRLALRQLERANLLEGRIDDQTVRRLSRREVLKWAGAAAAALPVVLTINAPAAAQTASEVACNNLSCGGLNACVNASAGQCKCVNNLCVPV